MKLFVIGATGRTGQEIVQQALGRGHQVTAFVRSPEGVGAKNERLIIVKGDVTDEEQLFNAMRNHMRDSLAMENIVQSNGLDWTIARPPRLTQGDSTTYRSREGAAPRMGFTLDRKAVAAFMLDAIEQTKHLHKIVGIAK